MSKGIGGHTLPNAGRSDDWLTPPYIIERLGPFDLDPCASRGQPWPTATRMIAPPEDGLEAEWEGRVWLNPPYGSDTERWLRKMANHKGGGIALIFARTETAMFSRWVWRNAWGLLFLEGRLYFHHCDGGRAKGNSRGPSVLVAYSPEDARALERCGLGGGIVREWGYQQQRSDLNF